MARSDLLVNLVRAGSQGDQVLFKRTVEALIVEERAKQHHVLADRLVELLQSNGQPTMRSGDIVDNKIANLLFESIPQRNLSDLLLPEIVKEAIFEIIEEHRRTDILRSYNLEPRNRVLLIGPPGNGKTSLAEAVAEALMLPFITVRYEGVIGTYLGETAVRLKRLFDYVRTRRCVLFFDEFDTLGKERGDLHETGEIKRVVSSLLLQIDALPSHVIVITATNHPELLDRAVWRRFQLRLRLPQPTLNVLQQWFSIFEKRFGKKLGYDPNLLAEKLLGISFSEAEEFCTDIQRSIILSLPNENIKEIVTEKLRQWNERSKVSSNNKD